LALFGIRTARFDSLYSRNIPELARLRWLSAKRSPAIAESAQSTHCFSAISDYIALQRVRLCPVRLAGLPFWAPERPYIAVFERGPEKLGPDFPAKSCSNRPSARRSSHEPP
jgi:hypothetical protein